LTSLSRLRANRESDRHLRDSGTFGFFRVREKTLTLLPRSRCQRFQPMAFMLVTAYILNRIVDMNPPGSAF
jgi:hypothetical protein